MLLFIIKHQKVCLNLQLTYFEILFLDFAACNDTNYGLILREMNWSSFNFLQAVKHII